jgi:hypothetical protein
MTLQRSQRFWPTIAPMSMPAPSERQQWLAEFEAAARRPLPLRMRYAFIRTYKPVLDDAPFRAFETMADYRAWCEAHLPEWLGYGR